MRCMKQVGLHLPTLVAVGLATTLGACGKKASSDATPVTAATGPTTDNSPSSDTTAQKQVVSAQLTAAVTALSDGGVGSGGGGGTGAGLVGSGLSLADFGETRKCAATTLAATTAMATPDGTITWSLPAATPTVTVTRSFAGTVGAITYNTNADGSASGETEVWSPGPYWGRQNITPNSAGLSYGDVPAGGVPAVAGSVAGAPATSSGTLGSVGFRSLDGSWNGAPVWEVGTGYVGYVASAKIAATATAGMTMYLTTGLPTVTAAGTAPTVGGTYSATLMIGANANTASAYSVLGVAAGGVLPSFTTTGSVVVGGSAQAVGQAGTITKAGIPARLYNPPANLACNPAEPWPLIGWKFSQNVAGLTRVGTFKSNITHTYKKGSSVVVQTGMRTGGFDDPATAAPYTNTPSAPFYDENAGTVSLKHSVNVGAQSTPNTITSTYTPTGAAALTGLTTATYSSAPFIITTTRNLNTAWTWTTKTVASGTLTASAAPTGASATASVATTFNNVVFTNNSNKALACLPTSGTITAVITPADTTLEATTTTLRFGTSVSSGVTSPSGVTATVTCSGGSTGANNCSAAAEADDADYVPSGCNF